MTEPPRHNLPPVATDLIGRAATLLGDADRRDLLVRLDQAARRAGAQGCTVVVAGEFKMGKSSLVNALVNAPLCPVDDDVATAKPLHVGYSPEPSAAVVYRVDDDETEPRIAPIPFDQIESYVLDPPTADDAASVAMVRVGLPRKLFQQGLSLIDTPGVGGIGSAHSAMTVGTLPMADAVLFVTDAAQELTAPELEFLDMVQSLCPTITLVVPKVDFYPEWRTIVELNEKHFEAAGADIPVLPISTRIREVAISQNSAELNVESGYERLVDHLRSDLEATARRRMVADLATTIGELYADLGQQLESELAVLDDPDHSDSHIEQLERRIEEAEGLRSRAARWQNTLTDGVVELGANVDHDLKLRFREIVVDAEAALDEIDPAASWDDFAASVTDQVNRAIIGNYRLLHESTELLAERVARHFDADHTSIVELLDLSRPAGYRHAPGYEEASISERTGRLSGSYSMLRNSVGGIVMVGILGTAVGVTFAPWVGPVVAAFVGRKARRDEEKRQIEKRQREAKVVVRRYVDEAQFMAGKDTRDVIRVASNRLRDTFLERSEDLQNSTREVLEAAKRARGATMAQRAKRKELVVQLRQRIRAELDHLARARPEI